MFMKDMSKITVLLALLTFISTAVRANDVNRSWYKTRYTTTPDANIVGWHTTGTNKLCSDDDGAGEADVACDTVLVKSGSTITGWTYNNGDDRIGDMYELSACLIGMQNDGRAYGCVVTNMIIDGSRKAGYYNGVWIILTDEDTGDDTLAHEIGHIAGLDDIKPTVYNRIMNYISNDDNDRVIQSEANAYEDL